MPKKAPIYLLGLIILLSSCALFKKNRIYEHNGIEQNVEDIPVFVYPSKYKNSKKMVMLLSGDGGWIKFEDSLATKFSEHGFTTIGLNSRSYFWKQRTPEKTAEDIANIIKQYALKYKTVRIFLCGYSFGADVLPFVYCRLPYQIKKNVIGLAMLSPFATNNFMLSFGDLINIAPDNGQYNVLEEVHKVNIPIYCFYGNEETERALSGVKSENFHLNYLKGGHRYDFADLHKIVYTLQALNRKKLRK